MSKFTVTYRNEFYADIEAETIKEAIKKFEEGDCYYHPTGELHSEYIQIFNEKDEIVYNE